MNASLTMPVHRLAVSLLLIGVLSACSPLWGTYSPPVTQTPPAWTLDPPTPAATWTPVSPSPTSTPLPPTATPTLSVSATSAPQMLYYSQSGDYLPVVASHFGVDVSEIASPVVLLEMILLDPGTVLVIPYRLGKTTPDERIMPDSEVVFSATAIDFNVEAYVAGAGGHLSIYREYLASSAWTTGAGAIRRIAEENSLNPRLILALLEYESHWVTGQPTNLAETEYPLGNIDWYYKGLFRQLMWAARKLSAGYYGWRDGTLTELTFPDGTTIRLSPQLNAGTVALQYYFSQTYNPDEWAQVIDPHVGFPALYAQMFGDPWARAQVVEPLFPPGLTQPSLSLPFEPGKVWSFSSGPHAAWDREGALAALDFAPPSAESGCVKSNHWVLASAPGLVVRSGGGVVALDLDGDGHEQTGWVLVYLHVSTKDRAPLGAWLNADDPIGHPSCEGGVHTGTHLHFVRKYNGEWVLAAGPLPFTLSGWVAHAGEKPYEGTLTKGDQVVTAIPNGSFETGIVRTPDE